VGAAFCRSTTVGEGNRPGSGDLLYGLLGGDCTRDDVFFKGGGDLARGVLDCAKPENGCRWLTMD